MIITPTSINAQWVEEIKKHVHMDSFSLFIYEGVQKSGFIHPAFLSDHDLVLMTYETLRKEINYVDLPHASKVL